MTDTLTPDLGREIRGLRRRFAAQLDPVRPELHRYCRALTGDPWDAEDLVQETLLRGFAKLAEVHWEVERPRAWLFRVATNLWIDRRRKRLPGALPEGWDPADEPVALAPEVREALERLARQLPPRERVAVLLKDVFGWSLSEVAAASRTSVGAVKAALHRGRTKLNAAPPAAAAAPGPELPRDLLDAFCAAFNDRDMPRLVALFHADVEAEVVGMVQEYGRDQLRQGSLHHTLFDEAGDPQAAVHRYGDEWVVVLRYAKPAGVAVEDVLRFEVCDGALSRLRYYYFCPEVLAEVTAALGLPLRANGYRYPLPHPEGEVEA